MAWDMSSTLDGMRESSWRALTGAASGGSGSRSNNTPRSSAPETPSIVLWCILVTSAILPSSTPSTIHISHSGRSRWSWRLMTSAAKSPSSRMPPGAGRAARRRWLSMSNSGSSTQTGKPSRRGTSTRRRWKTGASGMRSLMSWRRGGTSSRRAPWRGRRRPSSRRACGAWASPCRGSWHPARSAVRVSSTLLGHCPSSITWHQVGRRATGKRFRPGQARPGRFGR